MPHVPVWTFLFDANLPPALAVEFKSNGFAALHAAEFVAAETDDFDIWELAGRRGDVIVTKDADFASFVTASNTTQAVVWLRMGNTRRQALVDRIGQVLPDIIAALDVGERLIEVR